MRDKRITGQLFFREAERPADKPGKKLMIVVGVVAVHKKSFLKGEHIYPVTGLDRAGVVRLDVHMRFADDLTETARGETPDGLMRKPIWRV